MKTLRYLLSSVALALTISPLTAFAQSDSDTVGYDKAAELIGTITNVITDIQTIIINGGGAIVVLMVVIGGIQYIMNQKDAGKKTITAALTGAIIVILSTSLIALLKTLLGEFNKS